MWIWFLTLVIGWAFGLLFGAWLWYPAYLQYLKWENQIQKDLESEAFANEQFNKITD